MKILLLSRFFPYVGGREVLVLLLAQELSKNNDVVLATPDLGRISKDFNIISNDNRSLTKCLRSFKPDIVHSHTFYLTPNVLELSQIYNIPVILTVHGDIYSYGSNQDKKLFSSMVPKLSHIVTVCDQGTQQLLINGVDSKKVSRIYPGISNSMFAATNIDKMVFRGAFQLPADKFIFVTPARMSKYKGLEMLLDAISMLKSELRSICTFWITTPATRYRNDELVYTKEILKKAASLGIIESIIISFTDFSVMPFVYKSADAFILPSITEQLPVSILEAMTSGLTIIATSVGGVPELVNKKTGYLIPSGNSRALKKAIETVFNGGNSDRINSAHKLVDQKFNLARMKNEYLNLYRIIVRNNE